jgi:hypothetical protein
MAHRMTPLNHQTRRLCADDLERAIQTGDPEIAARFVHEWGDALRAYLDDRARYTPSHYEGSDIQCR